MKAAPLTLVVLFYIGICSAFADGTPATNALRGPAGIIAGESLLTARAKLLEHDWKPTRIHASDDYEYSGVERELAMHHLFEVDTCSFDSSRCILFYSRKGACLRVDTIGERLNDMTVTHWADMCPGAPASGKGGTQQPR
ncbi:MULTISPECIES: hypothetical protein [Pseudomonas]|uniref:Uncharacterized protein n=1 Tax=Pseudomonas piscis TaxID=2614538 RepID=A0ABY9N9Y7_9PSED|nr:MULTISPECIES: hypothetical protein [Pseudomonas]WMN15299.1 hypothetical protein QL104_18190 [Pseudomonas piscis]